MPRYRIKGQIIEANDEAEARALAEGPITRFGHGVAAGAKNVGANVANMLLPEQLEPQWATKEAIQKRNEDPVLYTPAGRIGKFVGETAATMPLGAGVGSVAAKAIPIIKTAPAAAIQAARALAAGGAAGAAEGAITAGPEHRVAGTLMGGGLGMAGGALLPAVGKKLSAPINPTPEAKRLIDMGVDLTPGQMNPKHWIGQVEEIASKAPFIANARESAQEQAVRRLLRKTAAPGSAVSAMTDDAIDALTPGQLNNLVHQSYTPAYAPLKNIPAEQNAGLSAKYIAAVTPENRFVASSPDDRAIVERFLTNQAAEIPDNPTTGQLQKLRSDIRNQLRKVTKAANAGNLNAMEQKELYELAEDRLTRLMEESMSPEDAAKLEAIDKQYAQHMVLDDAMQRLGNAEVGFTPAQAMRSLKTSEGKSFGRGGSGTELSEDIRAMQKVLTEKTPVTGARMIVPTAVGALIGAKPAAALGMGLAATASTKAGRKMMAGNTQAQRALAARLYLLRNPAAVGAAGAGTAALAPNPEDL